MVDETSIKELSEISFGEKDNGFSLPILEIDVGLAAKVELKKLLTLIQNIEDDHKKKNAIVCNAAAYLLFPRKIEFYLQIFIFFHYQGEYLKAARRLDLSDAIFPV